MILHFFFGRLGDFSLPSQAIQHIEFKHVLCNLGIATWMAEWANSNCPEVYPSDPAISDAFQKGIMLEVCGCF